MEASLGVAVGLLIGSFLNVCIYRWPRDLSVVRPRSHCVVLRAYHRLVRQLPVLSFVVLGGRCRYCRARVSARYPLVELLTGVVFAVYVWYFGSGLPGIKLCLYGALLIGLFFADLEERILPDEFTLGGALAGFVFAWFVFVKDGVAEVFLWMAGVHWGPQASSLWPNRRWAECCPARFCGSEAGCF